MDLYNSYFSFMESPFNLTPDPRFLYMSACHKGALDIVFQCVSGRKGLTVITGDIGTGKTTICRTFPVQLDACDKRTIIFNSFISDMELLEILIKGFNIDMDRRAKSFKENIYSLRLFLARNYHCGGNAILLVDEAQNLPYSTLKQILRLSGLREGKDKLIQTVLVGQNELGDNLDIASLKDFNRYIAKRYELKPLGFPDIQKYIEHRLEVAGGSANVRFGDGVFETIYGASLGSPRRINAICDRALLIACLRKKQIISRKIVDDAIIDLRYKNISVPEINNNVTKFRPALLLIIILPIIVTILSIWIIRENHSISSGNQKIFSAKIVKPLNTSFLAIRDQDKTGITSPKQEKDRIMIMPLQAGRLEAQVNKQNAEKDKYPAKKAPKMDISQSDEKALFSVQVGAYLVKENAIRMLNELAEKGYDPSFVVLLDFDKNLWYSVRIHKNSNFEAAIEAVLDFEKMEGKRAIITQVDSLDPVPFRSFK